MNAIQQFNGLNGRSVSRETLQELVEQAKKENATVIIYRISKILNDFPDEEHFDISLKQYPEPPHSLNGAIHTRSYKKALDESGSVRKGWKFVDGEVVKVEKKPQSESRISKPKKHAEKQENKEQGKGNQGLNAPQLALTTEDFKKMSVKELRAFTLQYYNENLKGKTAIIKKYLKEVVFTTKAGRKIAHGEAMV